MHTGLSALFFDLPLVILTLGMALVKSLGSPPDGRVAIHRGT